MAASTELSDHSINTWWPGREGQLNEKPVRGKCRGRRGGRGGGGGGNQCRGTPTHHMRSICHTDRDIKGNGREGEGGSIIQHLVYSACQHAR